MSKKLLSVVLALALVLSSFAVSAFAIGAIGYEDEKDVANYTQAWSLNEAVNNGNGTYSVDVILDANYGVGPIQFQVIKTVSTGTLTLTGAAINEDVIPDNWMADIAFDDGTGEVAINPNPEEDGVSAIDVEDGKVIATLTYTASADVYATLEINVADAKSATNPGGTLIAARMSDGNVVTGTAITGQTVSQTTNKITIGSAAVTEYTVSFEANGGSGSMADVTVEDGDSYTLPACAFTAPSGYEFSAWSVNGAEKAVGDTITVTANTTVTAVWVKSIVPPTLAVIDGTIGVIDTTRTMLDENQGTECDGYIYGLEPFNYETVGMIFEVVGDGSMNIVANDYGSESGTGTMVQVLDLDGNVVAEYVLIVFGDVDGDGEITVLDASEVELHAGWAYPDSYGMGRFEKAYTAFAACVDGCGDASTLDASEIELTAGWAYPDADGNGYLSQATIISLL